MIKTEININTPQWNKIDYRLQLILGLPAANPIKIFKFTNSQTAINQLKQNYKHKTILDSFININLIDQQKIKKIFYKKNKMEQLEFQTGHLQIDVAQQRQKKFTLWLLKIMVGNSYCIPQNQKNTDIIIPSEYDSIYLVNKKQIQQLYRHNYKLKDPNQYVIQYEVVFEFDKKKQFNPRAQICNKCQKRSAGVYCKQQQAFFCSQCNITHHKQKLLNNHSRQEINKFNTMPLCKQPQHNRRLELYCLDCNRFLCVQCTIIGDHSVRSMNQHNIRNLKKLYEQKSNLNIQLAKVRKQQLSHSLKKIDEIMREVQDHGSFIQKKIIQQYEKSLKQLKKLTKQKIDYLLTIQIQTKRQYDQCVWTDSFVKYQQQILKPTHYISIQDQYQNIKKEHSISKIKKDFSDFKHNDIEINGEIKVYLKKPYQYEERVEQQIKWKKFNNNIQENLSNKKRSQKQEQAEIFKSPEDEKKNNTEFFKIIQQTRQNQQNFDQIFRPKTTAKRIQKSGGFEIEQKSKINSEIGDKKKARSILQTSLKKNGFILT